jgi:hypothetical protein
MYTKHGFAKIIVIAGGLAVAGLLGAPSALADAPVCPAGYEDVCPTQAQTRPDSVGTGGYGLPANLPPAPKPATGAGGGNPAGGARIPGLGH